MRTTRKRPTNYESQLQSACVRWFRIQYPKHSRRLFAIPNGGKRNVITARRLKLEGVLAGVPDLLLAIPKQEFGALFIEMKFGNKGRLTDEQQSMHKELSQHYCVKVARSFDEFRYIVEEYLA